MWKYNEATIESAAAVFFFFCFFFFSTDLKRPQYELNPVNAIFCLCLENSSVYFPFLFTDCLQ